ncbi:MAG: molecular chaperone DnaK, partial [Deltaproteobacteria bacterium]|nr:molecular chaperone DnaK [Deltaproteobacteria bacterium]
TTNTCVAILEGSIPVVIPNKNGYKTTPSIVAISESGKRLVGQIAKRQAITNATNTVFATKRLIGRKWDSEVVQAMRGTVAYKLVAGPHDDVRVELRERIYSLPEISSFVLAEMKMISEEYLGSAVKKVVITVPAYFNDAQRQATRNAGRLAGLEVVRIINEPTAAALAYGKGKTGSQRVAVFDLGGGTFDISILEIADGVFEVLATGGDSFLGGEDFDARIIEWLVYEFAREHQIDLRQDTMALQRLRDASEKAKCELSTIRETEINLPFIISSGSGEALHLQKVLQREQLQGMTIDLIERTLRICRRVLDEANITTDELDEVILVGGQTRMPKVQELVAELFGKEPSKGVHPDEVVACGAAIQGAVLVSGSSSVLLVDVTPHNLGVMIMDGSMDVIIPQNSRVPTARTRTFTTVRDNQTAVKIMVFQGEHDRAIQNTLLGEFILYGLRPAKAREVQVDVTFDINADGIVSVTARNLETGEQTAIQVSASSSLTEQEIQKMMADNEGYQVQVKSREEVERRKVEVGRTIQEVERLLPRVQQVLDGLSFGGDAIRRAQSLLLDSKAALRGEEMEKIASSHENLERTLTMFKGLVNQG